MKRVRDFHSQSWNNPFFHGGHSPRRNIFLQILNIVGFAVAGGVLIYIFAYSSIFRISNIEVLNINTTDTLKIRVAVNQKLAGYDYFVIPKDHYFSIEPKGIENNILLNFPQLRQVTVEKKFRKIIISVEEKKPTYRMIVGDKSYLLDQDSIGLRLAEPGEGDALIALSQESINFSTNTSMVPGIWLTAISDLHKYFATQVGVRDRLYRLDRINGNIEVVTTEDWFAIIDPSLDIQAQLKSLSATLIGKFKNIDHKQIDYIDVRFGDKIYYKARQ